MREIRPSGSEGGGTEVKQFLLPLSTFRRFAPPDLYLHKRFAFRGNLFDTVLNYPFLMSAK
jgi:hypothetical protein